MNSSLEIALLVATIFSFFYASVHVCLVLFVTMILLMVTAPLKEGYRDPIYLNREKMICDWYPRANGTIYGPDSHVMSGFQYSTRAY